MEKNHKNTDCYFFYYSTCNRGDNCAYRHEASALGCETVCSYWQQGSCLNQHCNFRHMEIKKNRKVIPCYWEKFPTGCKKPHCPFLHRTNRNNIANPIEPVKSTGTTPAKPANQEWTNRPDAKFDGNSTESEQNRNSSEAGSFIGSPVVDPLIVNFEEESDSESAPSPVKSRRNRVSSCKTYEEIRLEEIQAESAAFYSYAGEQPHQEQQQQQQQQQQLYPESPDTGGSKITRNQRSDVIAEKKDEMDFEVLSLEEIRQRRRMKNEESGGGKKVKIVRQVIVVSRPEGKKEKEEAMETEDDFLKNAIKTPDDLRGVKVREGSPIRVSIERRKRSSQEVGGGVEEQRTKRAKNETPKTRPIRLKRTRIATLTKVEDQLDVEKKKEEEDEEATRAKERLNEVEAASWRQSVEVRMCDSSTDDRSKNEVELFVKKEAGVCETEEMEKEIMEVEKITSACDSIVKVEKTSNLQLDESNEDDDILKDIDALLS